MDSFIDLPLNLPAYRHKGKDLGLILETAGSFNPSLNPVHRHIKAAFFMVCRGKAPVGRIAAIKDMLYPNRDTGFFGCFECANLSGAAALLLDAAKKWLWEKGCRKMIGPVTFNTNQKVGFKLQGAPAPQPMIPGNPSYYNDLMRESGLTKHTDLYTYSWLIDQRLEDSLRERGAQAGQMPGVALRPINTSGLQEAGLVRKIYNGSMQGSWGFVPLTAAESSAMLKYCSSHADPDLMVTVWYRGLPAGMFIFLPTALSPKAPPKSVRAAVMGVLPPFRRTGLGSYMIGYLEQIVRKKGYRQVDISMIHEGNGPMRNLLSRTGAGVTGIFRVYQDDREAKTPG
ncbi:MAG: hypothetical protein JL50_12395 [Peptococcaceae bacterium BICA1-7]|nr:MAG: hypothetical protein JL50_12395 [Peptococcaceae bacterium BICA1-7]HBV97030.1 N-acetyltransferase [Desulfotomaculum sp.]